MLQYVNSVLVGKAQAATVGSKTNAGDIIMIDDKGALIADAAGAAAAKKIKLGLVSADTLSYADASGVDHNVNIIKYSNYITPDAIVSYKPLSYSAPIQDSIVINASSATIKAGNRYVLRLIYRDLYEHPGQFTHTYEYIAADNDNAEAVMTAFMKMINKDTRRRCTASVTGAVLTLTALAKDDNEGKESINIYTRVNMEARMWFTNPSATGFASKNKYPLDGVTISKTAGFNGIGYWKEVRDREQAALSYRGITNRTWWPVIKPELNVEVDGQYDGCVIEFVPEHANAEDSFSKTKQSVEVYFKNTVAFASTMIGKQIAAFYSRSAS